MTIKQFFQVAGGALAALFFYSTALPPYFKVPLIIVSFLIGLALAFLPLQDRPLSQWILLFAKAIYSPSIFIWNKLVVAPVYFQPDTLPGSSGQQTRPGVKIPTPSVPKIPAHQEIVPVTPMVGAQTSKTVAQEKKLEVGLIDQPPESSRLERSETEFLSKVAAQFTAIAQDFKAPMIHVTPPKVDLPRREPVAVPKIGVVTVEKSQKPVIVSPPELKSVPQTEYKITPMVGKKIESAKAPEFSSEATPPAPPITPNIIVGQVIEPTGRIIEGAIIEIRDAEGRPVRALKTNRLGHFTIATPLANGKYILIVEGGSFTFDHVEFEAKGEIISPIAIRAKAV